MCLIRESLSEKLGVGESKGGVLLDPPCSIYPLTDEMLLRFGALGCIPAGERKDDFINR